MLSISREGLRRSERVLLGFKILVSSERVPSTCLINCCHGGFKRIVQHNATPPSLDFDHALPFEGSLSLVKPLLLVVFSSTNRAAPFFHSCKTEVEAWALQHVTASLYTTHNDLPLDVIKAMLVKAMGA